jgi:hypothetical protein
MRNQEYEDSYSNAREVLYTRGKKIGGPLRGQDGLRYCPVDGFLLTDRDLLKEAWGESLADEILAELAQSDSLPRCCPEGNRLWEQYSRSTRCNLQILIERQIAASKQDCPALTQLVPLLRQAAESRQQVVRYLCVAKIFWPSRCVAR